jgi:hypothetical protein
MSKLTRMTLAGFALAGTLLAQAAPAFAAPPAQTPEPPGAFREQAQEYALKREQLALDGLALRIDLAEDIAAKSHEWVDWLKSQGKDTAVLEAALATYEAQVNAAQVSWDGANAILSNPAGFDDAGNVTDPDEARETLRAGADALRQTHRILADAGRAFRRAVQDFRLANRPGA